MKKLFMMLIIMGTLNGQRCPVSNSCASKRGANAAECIRRGNEPWYYRAPEVWYGYGNYFASPMNRKYYGGDNAFPGPGRWIGAQW